MNILQNLRFTDNQAADQIKKPFKTRIVINYLFKAFPGAMSDTERQSIDEDMIKFECHDECKGYMKSKPVKWGFKWSYSCCSKNRTSV